MKKFLLLAACLSTLLLLSACSNSGSSGDDEDPVVQYENMDYTNRYIKHLLEDCKDSSHSLMLMVNKAYKLCSYDNDYNNIYFNDSEFQCSDRSIVEIYQKGIISTKTTGHVTLNLKSKKNNVDVTLNVFVLDAQITPKSNYTEVKVTVPEGISSVWINRTPDTDSNTYADTLETIGKIRSYRNNGFELVAGEHVFKDYFISNEKEYYYRVTAYNAETGWGNGILDSKVKTIGTSYAEFTAADIKAEFSGFDGKILTLLPLGITSTYPITMVPDATLYLKDIAADQIYTHNFNPGPKTVDLFNAQFNDGSYAYRGKTLSIEGIILSLYDNSSSKSYMEWYPVTGDLESVPIADVPSSITVDAN